ncbi:MAG TPA: hypothetical protein VI997_06035 [Candidatus Thermoplasmatota archaeon]|nr:hypothetical protein [Candidatus Thermoplasmatota archaeon]
MRPLANTALLGFALFALASAGLGLVAGADFLFFLPAWMHLLGAVAASAVAYWALRASDWRFVAGAGLLGLVLMASASSGLPTAGGWVLAIVGGLGFVLYAENAVLMLRLDHVSKAEGALEGEAGARLARDLRKAEMRPLLTTVGLLVLAVALARVVFLIVDPSLAASLEVGGGYGLVTMTLVVAGGILVYRKARGGVA